MNSDIFRRVPLLVAGLLAFLALSSSSAFAAGKPVIYTFEPNGLPGTLNSVQMLVRVNPNGASTTYKIEYGTTVALGESTGKINIGSGTSIITQEPALKGLLPDTKYYARLVAENSFGTVSSATITLFELSDERGQWRDVNKTLPALYSSIGSFAIKFPSYFNTEIACFSSGSGTLGNKGGIGDKYTIHPSGCKVYVSGKQQCTASLFSTMQLNERLISSEPAFTVHFSEGCSIFFSEQITLPVSEPFTATDADNYLHSELSVLLQGKTWFGVHEGTIIDSSTWQLTGEDKGDWFRIREEYGF